MKGLKFLVSCAAVAAVSAACATASFAITATPNLTKDVNADTYSGTVNVEAFDEYAKNVEGDLTLLVLNSDKADVTKDMIEQILQIPNDGNKTGVLSAVKLAGLEAGTYYVRLGGADAEVGQVGYEAVSFEVGEEEPTYTLGDVNNDTFINMGDAASVLNHFTGNKPLTDDVAKLAADVNKDTFINMGDAAAILNHFTGNKPIVQ